MTDHTLSTSQRKRLQRWFDGELDAEAQRTAEELYDTSDAARRYIATLEQLQAAVRAAFEEVHARADRPKARDVADRAIEAPPLEDQPLEALAETLVRFYDGDVTEPERLALEDLRERRRDVEARLDELDGLGRAVRAADEAARERADVDGMWNDLERELEHVARGEDERIGSYDPESDRVLLHRYADGEASPGERQRVEAWLERGEPEVEATLRALDVLGDGVRASHEEVVGAVDFDTWQRELNASLECTDRDADGGDIVSLAPRREETSNQTSNDPSTASKTGVDSARASTENRDGIVSFLWRHRRGAAGAVAALFLAITAAALGGYLSTAPRPGGTEGDDSIVIVDDISYGAGASVRVDGSDESPTSVQTTNRGSNSTVIWLFENGQNHPTSSEDGHDANSH